MSLTPFSSRPSPRSPGAVGAGGEKKTTGRKYTLSLSFAGLVTSVIIMIIAVGWIFAFGVIVGRGYNPEKQLPELARLLPPPAERAEERQPILKPEELTFMAELKQQTSSGGQAVAAQPEQPKPAVSVTPAPVREKADPPTTTVRSDYVFQAVAYKKREQADRLREKMEGEGLRTRMTIEKDKQGRPKWFRVQVMLRGKEEDATEAKAIMARMGIKDPQLLSKKPVKR